MSKHPHRPAHNDPNFAAPSRSTWEIIRRVVVYLRPYKLMAAGTISCAILSLAFSFVFPKATQYLIDEIIGRKQFDMLGPTILVLLGAFFLRDYCNCLRIRLNNAFEQNVIYDMRRDVYGHLQRLPVRYFDQRASGDLMTRVIEDVNAVERLLIDGTEQGVVALLSIIGVLIFMLSANVKLTLVALIPLPMLVAGAMAYTLTAHQRYRLQRQASSAMNALLMDNLQGIRAIKAFRREAHEDQHFAVRADDLRTGTLAVMKIWAIYSPAMAFCTALGSGLVLWVGGQLVIANTLTLGELMAFLFLLALFYEPIGKLHGLNQMLQSARTAGERVFDILDAQEERSPVLPPAGRQKEEMTNSPSSQPSWPTSDSPATAFWPPRGAVLYENVNFAYSPERAVLKNVNLSARPGEMIALVGPTGAGKSTLVHLLPAFYETTAGRIFIDGKDIREIPLAELRAQIAVVSQEPFLFNGTLRENILYGKLEATEAELLAAAQAANCHEFITRLPAGYDARVGERGVKLSGGEKQRVSMARALLKNAPILILDEATASVDTATERLIQEALERLMANRTSFVIAHRLSTIRRADQILVLQHGEIVERGTHETLLAQNGLYAKLARIQNTTFIEEGFARLSAG